jgi:hypothetical protein
MALHIDCDRVHGDMGCSHLYMDSKRRAVTAKALGSDAQVIDRMGEFAL